MSDSPQDGILDLWPTKLMRRRLPGFEEPTQALVKLIRDMERVNKNLTTDYLAPDFFNLDDPAVGWLREQINQTVVDYLRAIGIDTVKDLLGTDPDTIADLLDAKHIPAETVRDWQDQTQLRMAMPGLRIHDVQILVGAGIRTPEDLANTPATDVLKAAMAWFDKPETRRIINEKNAPNAEEVDHWIVLAKSVAE